MATVTKVLVVDDHQLFREGLCALLEKEPDIVICGQAENGRLALEMCEKVRPNVLVMDITMPDLNGIDAARQLTRDYPDVKVLGLSIHCDRRYVREMIKAGARGYLPKRVAYNELARAIREIVSGYIYLSPAIAGFVVEDYVTKAGERQQTPVETLAPREREVIQLIAEGKTTKEIAGTLHISVKTVEWHRREAMEHLNVDNLASLIKLAIREGLTSVDI